MLVEVYPYKNRTDRIKHYSDAGMYIRQIVTDRFGNIDNEESGTLYVEAIDVYPTRYTYEETDEPIEVPEEDPENIVE